MNHAGLDVTRLVGGGRLDGGKGDALRACGAQRDVGLLLTRLAPRLNRVLRADGAPGHVAPLVVLVVLECVNGLVAADDDTHPDVGLYVPHCELGSHGGFLRGGCGVDSGSVFGLDLLKLSKHDLEARFASDVGGGLAVALSGLVAAALREGEVARGLACRVDLAASKLDIHSPPLPF